MEVRVPSIPLVLEERLNNLQLPPVLQDFGASTAVIDTAATVWGPVPGTVDLSFGELDRPLEVVAHYGGVSVGATGGYSMVGVDVTGALDVDPDKLPDGTVRFAFTPFSTSTDNVHVSGSKPFVLPVGTTNFRLSFRRNTAVARNLNYSHLIVVPVRWLE